MMARKIKTLLSLSVLRSPVKSPRASILLITLWSLCLLSAFTVILGYEVRQKLSLINRLEERDKIYLIADAGFQQAAVDLRSAEPKSYDALNESWSSDSARFSNMEIGDGNVSICYDNKEGANNYGMVDEERKININKADTKTLERLLRIVMGFDETKAQELAASIVDWRDSDSQLSIPFGSAEDPDYKSLTYPYESKDAPFEVLDELLLVKGMDRDTFEWLKDYITVYGSGKVNANTASRVILLTLGLGDDIVDKILAFRAGQDKIAGTSDDGIFENAADIVAKLSQTGDFSASDIAQLSIVSGQYLVTNSSYFMIRCIARLNNKKGELILNSVVDRNGKILYYRLGA